jgi:ABC-type dipeptide/oligopeptide/nickel transport system permease subunit
MMLYEARGYMSSAPWYVFFPGGTIFLVVMAFVLLGDGLGDALEPRRHGINH